MVECLLGLIEAPGGSPPWTSPPGWRRPSGGDHARVHAALQREGVEDVRPGRWRRRGSANGSSVVDYRRALSNVVLGRDDVGWGPNNTFRFPHGRYRGDLPESGRHGSVLTDPDRSEVTRRSSAERIFLRSRTAAADEYDALVDDDAARPSGGGARRRAPVSSRKPPQALRRHERLRGCRRRLRASARGRKVLDVLPRPRPYRSIARRTSRKYAAANVPAREHARGTPPISPKPRSHPERSGLRGQGRKEEEEEQVRPGGACQRRRRRRRSARRLDPRHRRRVRLPVPTLGRDRALATSSPG